MKEMQTLLWSKVGINLGSIMFIWTMFRNYLPLQHRQIWNFIRTMFRNFVPWNYLPLQVRVFIMSYTSKLNSIFNPYININFYQFNSGWSGGSKTYRAIERYLIDISSSQGKYLKAKVINNKEAIVLHRDDLDTVMDIYNGHINLEWGLNQRRKCLTLSFHKKHKEVIVNSYIKHVLEEAEAIYIRDRQSKLYSNIKREGGRSGKTSLWSYVGFAHPATFEHLAMDPKKKQDIINDLVTFINSKDYYAKIGKTWKRGYLLHGPPGTGKSTMIAAMANMLKYDVYDLELTSVKDNTDLRELLIETSSRSIIVIEDIDCSLNLTGQRNNQRKEDEREENNKEREGRVTLSGLLNCVDGLWSSCGEERLFIFTTNYVEKLDPALIRRGRMDKHIELSYCCFESFKILAKNYLDIESHRLFPEISRLLREIKMTPADVVENLMSMFEDDDADTCLNKLIKALEEAIKLKAKEVKRLPLKKEMEVKRLKDEEEKRVKENVKTDVGNDNGIVIV